MTLFEIFLCGFAFIEHYVCALLVIGTAWWGELANVKKHELLQKQIVYYLIMLPLITSLICGAYKFFKDCKLKQISKPTLAIFGVAFINLIAFIVTVLLYESAITAFVIIGVGVVLLYFGVQFSVYNIQNYELHTAWYVIDGIFLVGISLGFLIALAKYEMTIFASSSIKLLFICCMLLLCLAFIVYKNNLNWQENPIFYSSWIMPVYQYNS